MKLKTITAFLAATAMICSVSTVSIAAGNSLPVNDSLESNADTTPVSADESIESGDDGEVLVAAAQDGKWPLLEGVGTIVEGGEVLVNGETNKLYLCFADPEEALEGIKAKVPSILSILAEEFHLAPLSDSNWEDYYDAMFMMFDSENIPENYNESNIEFRTLRQFFDFYENTEKNEEILGYSEILCSGQAGNRNRTSFPASIYRAGGSGVYE